MIPDMLHVVEDIKDRYPQAWSAAHRGGPDTHDFIKLLAARLHALDSAFGMLGQYGNPNDLAEDVVCYLGEGPGFDTITGQPISGFDVIKGAGGATPAPVWNFINKAGGAAWVAPWGGVPAPVPVPPTPPPAAGAIKPRAQFFLELLEINAFYAAAEGLQRQGGMVIMRDGVLSADVEALGAWGYDLLTGGTVEGALAAIQQSDEYKQKHPGGTP